MQLNFLVFLLSTIIATRAVTVDELVNDLGKVKTQASNLRSAIGAFPTKGATYSDALKIDSQVSSAISAIDKTNSDAKNVNTPISESDGQKVVDVVDAIRPIVEDALKEVVAKKASFKSIAPIGDASPYVKQDLTKLGDSTAALGSTLYEKAPANLQNQADAIEKELADAFETAIKAFS